MTNFGDTHAPDREGEIEYEQGIHMAEAAAATPTLEHYIWSTLPSGEIATGGKIRVPHADYKARVDEYIRQKLPDLAKKTTFLWMGFYATNLAYFPPLKPTYLVSTFWASMRHSLLGASLLTTSQATAKKHVWMHASSPQTILPINGEPSTNAGIYVRAILAQPQLTLPGRYVFIQTDPLSIADTMKLWSRITGKEGMTVEVSLEDCDKLWPAFGRELGLQLKFNEMVGDLSSTQKGVLGAADLGVEGEVVRLEESLRGMVGAWD